MRSLTGIILCGGQSLRMGRDKSLMQIGNLPLYRIQLERVADYCIQVFISCRKEQAVNYPDAQVIIDQLDNIGPAAGILAAGKILPEVLLLILPCDMVLKNDDLLRQLCSKVTESTLGCFFIENASGIIQPFPGIYSPTLLEQFNMEVDKGMLSIRKFLEKQQNITTLPIKRGEIHNLNTPEDFEAVTKK